MPLGDPVEEQLIDDVISTLSGITAGAVYNRGFETVQRQDRNVLEPHERPAAIVVHDGVTKDDGAVLPLQTCTLSLTIVIAINSHASDSWPKELALYASDVENALLVSPQRGGLAIDTAIVRGEVFDADDLGATHVVGAQLLVEITFRHLHGDTTQAF